MRAKNPYQMRHNIVINILLLGLCFVSGISASVTCHKGCPQSDNGLLQYKPGNVYEYNFDSILTVGVTSGTASDTDDTNLKVLGTAKIFAEGNCGYTLQLGAVKVTATKDAAVEKRITQSIQKPVHFTLVGGKLEPEICADPNDNSYALNIKRAIISLLQSSTEGTVETDVFGECPTHTSVSQISGAQIVTKVRNLNSCQYRSGINSGLISGVVDSAAGVKSAAIFEANYAKEAKIEGGILDNVHLVEEYNFDFTPKAGNHVRAKVITSLKLKNKAGSPGNAPGTGKVGVGIIFQKPEVYTAKNIAALKTALTDLVNLLDGYVHKDSAQSFVELIRLMRNADVETLLELASIPHPNKILGRKVYLDALFRTATADAAKAIMKQINKMDDKEKLIATLSLNIVKNVDKDTVTQAAALLTPNALKQTYLAVGNLASKYCQTYGCEPIDIELTSKKFTDSLKHCKANTKSDEERIIYVLKGIGNMANLASGNVNALIECANTGRSNRIRVAALQAFSVVECSAELQAKALSLLRDRNEDSELRIEAYLALIHCPSNEIATAIAEIVNSETVYQVGGFIASNLKAIRDSTDVTRTQQRYYLGNIRVTKQFPKNLRRYSYDNEISFNLEALGVGASSDYKLIYSQNGFLPRSARLNLTMEIFGTNFNVLEVSVRQEHLENVLEYYVGPKGLINKDFEEIMSGIQGGGGSEDRARRSIADDTGKFAKKYKTYGSKNLQDVNLDLALKFFGSEMLFLSLGDHIPSSLEDILKFFSTSFENIKKELNSFNKEFMVHNLFMDLELMYPTGVGIPLEFHSQGFAANKLDVAINVNVDDIVGQNWERAKYRLKLVPSMNVNLNVHLGFDAYVLETGMRLTTNSHSATGGDFNLAFINDGNGFNLDVELPRKKIELIDLQISPEFYVAELDKPIRTIQFKDAKKQKTTTKTTCLDKLGIVGLNFCVETTIKPEKKEVKKETGDLAWLLRPHSISIYATSELKYNFKGYHEHLPSGNKKWKLDFSTPGSQESHDTSITLEIGTKNHPFTRLSFNNPQYKVAVETGISNSQKELVLYTQYENNDDIKRNRVGFIKNGNEYRPIIEIQNKEGIVNDINGYRADGKVVLQKMGDKQERYIFQNFQMQNKENDRIVVNGWTDVGTGSLKTELHVIPGKHTFLVKGNFKFVPGLYEAGLFINDEQKPENIVGGSASVKLGEQNYGLSLVSVAGTWECSTLGELQFVLPEGSTSLQSSKFKTEVNVKHKNVVEGSFKLEGSTEPHKVQVNAEGVRGKKTASLVVKYSGQQRNKGDYAVEVNSKYQKHFIDILAKCEVSGNKFIIDNVLSTSWDTLLTVKGELGQRYTAQDIHIDLQGAARFSSKDKQTQWLLTVLGAPEKTTSEFKLLRDTAEVIKYTGELQHPQEKITAGKLQVNIKNVVAVKGDLKVTKNGKGELSATVETQKTEPKHKFGIGSKFTLQAPKYEIESTITLDGEKRLYFKTENVLDRAKFSTKNVAEVEQKQVTFEANGSIKGDAILNGEIQGNFALTCPNGHVLDGSLKRKFSTNPKTGQLQGNGEVVVTHTAEGKKRSITANVKVDKFNRKARDISQNIQVAFTNFDGKKVEVASSLKHLPKGNYKSIDWSYQLQSDYIKEPVNVELKVDEYSGTHAVFKANAIYGGRASAHVNGKYSLGQQQQPASYELQGNLQVPDSKFKSLQLTSSGKILRPATEEGGNYILELQLDERAGNRQFVKFDTSWKGSRLQGNYHVNLEATDMQGPLKLEGSYQREQQGQIKDGSLSGKQKYEYNFSYAGKYIKSAADLTYDGPDTGTIHYTLDSSYEAVKNMELLIQVQKLENEVYALKVQANSDSKTYTINSKIFRSTHKKGIDWEATTPSGQPIVILGIVEILGERKAKLLVDIKNVVDLDFTAHTETSYKEVDNFYIVAQWNSKKLNLNSYDLDVRSQGKSIKFNLKNAEAVVFAGSATYALTKERNKAIIEGQGQLQYKGKGQNINFKLIRQIYDINTDKEVGFSYTFNGNFGPKKGVSTLKITNKDFNVKLSICEEKKQCTNMQVQSIMTVNEPDLDSIQHSLLIIIDLRELGYPYEFEMQSKTIRQGLRVQYNLDSNIVSNNNLKYQLVANVQPSSTKVQLILPSRELLFESTQQYPAQGKIFGHYEQTASFYFDKQRKPNEVTKLTFTTDLTGQEYVAVNGKSKISFEHPSISPLIVSATFDANRQQQIVNGQLVFDIFRNPEQQIIASVRSQNQQLDGHGFNITTHELVQSNGLRFKYEFNGHVALNVEREELSAAAEVQTSATDLEAAAYFYANKERVDLTVKAMKEPILQLESEFNRQKFLLKLNTKLQVFSQKPVEVAAEIQPTSTKISVVRQGVINASGDLKLNKELKVNIEGTGKQLFNGRLALDIANFLQITYNSNEEDINTFLITIEDELKKDTEITTGKIKSRFEKLKQTLDSEAQLVKGSIPNFTQLKANYEANVNEIAKELEADPVLKQISETYQKIYTKISNIAGKIIQTGTESYENLHKSVAALIEKLETILRNTIIPAWEEFMVTASKITGELRVEILNFTTKAVQTIWNILEKYGVVLKNYGKAINETMKPFNEAAQELVKVIVTALEELGEELKEHISKLPTFEAIREDIREKLKKLELVEKVIQFVNDLFDKLHILPQTPETTQFLEKAHSYITAKLKNLPLSDENKSVKELLKLLMSAVRSIWSAYMQNSAAGNFNVPSNFLSGLVASITNSVATIGNIPSMLSFRFSLVNFLLNEDWSSVFSKVSFQSWFFFQDFDLKGHIADGRHIFTFDGNQYSFTSATPCKYILAQDMVDNNFTVIAQVNNGKLKSIILTDRDGSFIEIGDTGVLKMNGNAVEFPQHMGDIYAWRKFYTIWLRSKYGVEIMCTTDLKVCHLNVNGFYTSKTRGLLGNGNAEPHDDLIQVDGTMASDIAAFVNGYGLGKCQPAMLEPHDASKRSEICSEIFGLESPLTMGFIFLNSAPYKDACDVAVASAAEKDKESVACLLATAYGSALKLDKLPVRLPVRCLKCPGVVGQRDVGQEFSVKIPTSKADVVFIVDVDIKSSVLSNLIAPAITGIRETLKSRGFIDIQTSVIAYNESQLYPALLTSDGGKLNYQGNLADLQLSGPKHFCLNCISQMMVDQKILTVYEILERIIRSIEPQADEKAFNLALNYPFRAGAAKSIVAVRSNALEFGNLFKLLRAHIMESITNFDGALLHLIGPVKDMSLEGVATEKLIGFNSRLVATLDGKDAKKRQKLQFENDMGIDFVLNNGGWVFATQNFENLKPQDQQKALNQVTNTMADTLFKTEIVSECECRVVHGLHAQHKCQIKSSNFVPNKKPKSK